MTGYTLGIDSGSTFCKAVLFDGNAILATQLVKSSWQPSKTAMELCRKLLNENNVDNNSCTVISTGYGRENIDFAHKSLTEITAHSYGGAFLVPGVNAIIDIGGQDCKVIKVKNGKVLNFHMNDKCAAGTGRFLDMACNVLDVSIGDLDSFLTTDEYISINSMCTVFAESEIIGLMSKSAPREQILNGVIRSIATRIYGMLSKLGLDRNDKILMTGGLSRSRKITEILTLVTGHDIITHKESPFAGALGAAISGVN